MNFDSLPVLLMLNLFFTLVPFFFLFWFRNDELIDGAYDASQPPCCVVCQERLADVLLVPCGHFCLCSIDAQQIRERSRNKNGSIACPLCKKNVERMQTVYCP